MKSTVYYDPYGRTRGYARNAVGVYKAFQSAYRNAGSRTRTSNTRNDDALTSNQHTSVGSTNMTVTLYKKKPRHLPGQLRFFDARSKLITNGSGFQGAVILNVVGSKSQWLDVVPTAAVQDADLGPVPLIYQNPDQYNSGSAGIVANDADSIRQEAMLLSHVTIQYDMTNTCTTPNFVYFYVVTPKDDNDNDPLVDWNNAMLDVDFSAATAIYPPAGNTEMDPASVGRNQVGVKPNQFKLWNQKWRVLGVKKVELGSGASEKLSIQVKANYIARRSFMETTSKRYMKNKSVVVFAVQHGTVCVDNTLTPANTATYSTSSTAFCSQVRYLMHPVKVKEAKLDHAIGQQRISTGAIPGNQLVIDTTDSVAIYKSAQ